MKLAVSVLPLLALAACSTSGMTGLQSKYGPKNFFGGYSEKQVEPGVWKVRGSSNGYTVAGFGRTVATYRAAEIIKNAGFTHMQVINQKGATSQIMVNNAPRGRGGEYLDLWVRGTNDPSVLVECRAKILQACFTADVAAVLERLRPALTPN